MWCKVPEIWSATDKIFYYFGPFFALLPHWQPEKSKIQKNEKKKKSWRYHYFTQVYQKSWSYTILFLRYGAWRFILNCILAIYPPNGPKIQILKKIKKAPGDIIILRICTKKLWSHNVQFLKYGARRTNRRTDGNIEVGAPTKNVL